MATGWKAYGDDYVALYPLSARGLDRADPGTVGRPFSPTTDRRLARLRRRHIRRARRGGMAGADPLERDAFVAYLETGLRCAELARARLVQRDGGWLVHEVWEAVRDAPAPARLAALPEAIAGYARALRAAARRWPPPRAVRDAMVERLERLVGEEAPPGVAAALFEPVRTAVLPVLRGIAPRDRCGLASLRGGRALYAAALELHLGLDGTAPAQFHADGLAQVARLERELAAEPPAEDDSVVRGAEAVSLYRRIVAAAEGAEEELTALFGPELRASVPCRVEEMRSPEGEPGAYYEDGAFHVNPLLEHRPRGAEALAHHEAVPGHHFQEDIERRFRPRASISPEHTAYVEGWALYAETLLRGREPGSRRGRLESELFRAVRVVVDTGIHALGWSCAEAEAYLAAHAPALDPVERASEIVRYAGDPGQALAYWVGLSVFRELREWNADDPVRFHRRVLTEGSLPLRLLIRRHAPRGGARTRSL